MAEPVLSNVSITAPSGAATVRILDYKHGFYIKPFPATPGPVTFTAADNFAEFIPGAFALASTVEAEERTMLSGAKTRGTRTISYDNQTARVEVYNREARHTLLNDHRVDWPDAPSQGVALAFLRVYPDGTALAGACVIEGMPGEGDPDAQFGYDVEFSFSNVYPLDVAQPTAPPTYTSKSPETGPVGTTVTVQGSNLQQISSITVGSATVTVFGFQSAGTIAFNIPTGLAASATAYPVALKYGAGLSLAAGGFTVTA